jgi:hypothetical protein
MAYSGMEGDSQVRTASLQTHKPLFFFRYSRRVQAEVE